MSCSAIPPLTVDATSPEALSLLHQRLLLAEEETQVLIEDMGAMGLSRDQIFGSAERMGTGQRSVSPLKMRQVVGNHGMLWQDSVVSRVNRIESLLQILKITIFRMETERELDPSNTAHLKQQLAALQQERVEEHQASRREVMKLRDQLQQAYQERDEARAEFQRLWDTVEAATAAKMDVVLAAEKLKIIKLEMSQKLMEMKEQMRQESARSVEVMKSHSKLLERVEEMERVVEVERRQALLLQSECQALHVEVQTGWQQLEKEKARGRKLEEHRQQLKEQTAMKDFLGSELKTELKSVRAALQRQQTQNSKLLKEARELRAAADRVQAERSRVVEQLQEQDLLLEAARCNIQTELEVALTLKVNLQLELDELKGEHAQLLQSTSVAQEKAVAQRELLERTIERLRGELSKAKTEEETMRKDLECSKDELEDERRSLESQLSEAKREVGSLSSALQSQQHENRRLMGKVTALEQQQHPLQQVNRLLKDGTDKNNPYEKGKLKNVCGPTGGAVSQTFENILVSHTRLQFNGQTLQHELGGHKQELTTLKKDRLQAQREIRKHQAEVEKLQRLLTSTRSKNNKALQSVQKALDSATVDNKRLAQSMERAVITNSSLHRKLEQARDQYQATITLRDQELREAQKKISLKSCTLFSNKVRETVNPPEESQRLEWKDLQREEEVLCKQETEWERWNSTIQRWEAKRELAHIAGGSKPVRTQLMTQSH